MTGNTAERLVLDQGVPRDAATRLRDLGYECMHVGEIGMSKSADDEILGWSLGKNAIVVTLDADFHTILLPGPPHAHPYFFLRATTLTLRVCEIAPGVSASLMISACSCWCRFPLPVAGLALSDRPTYRTSRRVSSSRG